MKLLKVSMLVAIFILSGCAGFPLSNPTENDLNGSWVSVGLAPYAILEYRIGGKSILAMGGAEGEVDIATVDQFSPLENEFIVLVTSVTDKGDVTEFVGSFWGGQLALREKDVEEITMWFSRAEITEKAKRRVEDSVKSFLENTNE
ncbi:hypothetical protein [Teredinibacter franksiae]|uniref:hypothetical protein n=1 Tax=Teredinibacter franksiae TaxID=2761453 RepID=UPI001C8ADBE5|nr:hypothetical protein [Teredinibacter franksiae]